MNITQRSVRLRHDLWLISLIYANLLRFDMPRSFGQIGAKVTGVVTDRAIVAVLSASLIAPFFVPRINSVLDSVPFLRDHKSLSSIVAGIVVFGVAKTPRIPNIVSAVIVGIAGVFILAGILPLYTQITNRSAS